MDMLNRVINGEHVTDEKVEAWVNEAEEGYNPEKLKESWSATKQYKADSKGRAVGLTPGRTYRVSQDANGEVVYIPEVPVQYDREIEVSASQFEEFFGAPPEKVSVDNMQVTSPVRGFGEEFYPSGIAFQQFTGGEIKDYERPKETVIIKIRKDV